MTEKFIKLFEIEEKGISSTKLLNKEESENLRGKIIILKPEESEIAKKLEIKTKGVYGAKFRI